MWLLTIFDIYKYQQCSTYLKYVHFGFSCRPKKVITSLAKNLVYSTAFLSSMVMLAKYTICLLRNHAHQPPPLSGYIPLLGGLACGLSVLFERASRRKELALFVVPHSIYAFYNYLNERKILPNIPGGSSLLFALSMVSIMHAYEREPESLSMLLNGVLRFFVGDNVNTVIRPVKRIRQLSDLFTHEDEPTSNMSSCQNNE